jgi:phospholipase C
VNHVTITQLSLVFGCYSWIKQDFEADFDNIEHVSIMNDNWNFDNNLGKISAQKGIGATEPHQSLVSDVVPTCDVYELRQD